MEICTHNTVALQALEKYTDAQNIIAAIRMIIHDILISKHDKRDYGITVLRSLEHFCNDCICNFILPDFALSFCCCST